MQRVGRRLSPFVTNVHKVRALKCDRGGVSQKKFKFVGLHLSLLESAHPSDFFQANVRTMISEHQYEVLSAGIYYIPNCHCSIDNDKEATAAEAFLKALENCQGVTGVHHNLP